MANATKELTGLRLAAQRISTSDCDTPADVVRRMLAMQAQDLPGARWSVGLRLPGSTESDIEHALASGDIVRSWPMRGTLHFVTPDDLGWILDICAPRQAAVAAKRRQDLEITDAELLRAADVAANAMSGGISIRRDALLTKWQQAGIPTTGQRAYHLLWNLGQRKHIVFGPPEGKHPTFALFDEWVKAPRSIERDQALAEFAGRYFGSHGPATVRDFAWWAGITLSDARRGVAAASGLQERDFDGVAHYFSEGLEIAPQGVHALPGFDEYMLGYQDRLRVLPAEFASRIVPGNNGMFMPTIVAGGQVVGTWKRQETAKIVHIEETEFSSWSKVARTGFEGAIAKYGQFVGKPIELHRSSESVAIYSVG